MKRSLRLLAIVMVVMMLVGFMTVNAKCKDGTINTYDVDAGGFNLKMEISDINSKYTVIFEHGLGGDRTWWDLIQPEIAKQYNTVSYDRAGAGESQHSTNPRLFSTMCKELHTALKNAKVKGPYIFIGHSYGGPLSRMYKSMYPKEVAGIIFVDVSHEDMMERMEPYLGKELMEQMYTELTGVEDNTKESIMASFQEMRDIRSLDALRETPITVLTATTHYGGESEEEWMKMQDEIAALSNNSKHDIIPGGHLIPLEQPKIVIDAVYELVSRISGKPKNQSCPQIDKKEDCKVKHEIF